MAAGICGIADRVKTISTYASVVAALAAGLAAFRPRPAPAAEAKRSWMRTLLKGLRAAASIWLALRARRQEDA